jgi:hypothetical protein
MQEFLLATQASIDIKLGVLPLSSLSDMIIEEYLKKHRESHAGITGFQYLPINHASP